MLRTRGIASLLAGALLVAGCSTDARDQAGADEPVAGKVAPAELRLAITGPLAPDPAVLNPTRALDVLASDLLFDGLTRFDAATDNVLPSVAKAWSTADGVSWRFELDPERTFSDGAPITADDVAASFDRVATLHASSIGGGRLSVIAGFSDVVSGVAPHLSGVRAIDPATVGITLTSANYELPALLADPTYGVVAHAAVGAPAVASQTAFSGPFRVQSGGADGATLVATGQVDTSVDAVEFVRVADDSAALAALRTGDVDIAPLPDATAAPIGSTPVTVSAATMVLEVSSSVAPWNDVAAHQALLTTLDRSAIAAAATGAESRIADSVVPGGIVTGACVEGCSPTPEGAAALAAVGARPTTAHLDVPAGTQSTAAGAEIARQLGAVGLPTEVRASDASSLRAALGSGSLEMAVFAVVGLAPSPDPYLVATMSSAGGENLSGFASGEFDAALQVARATVETGPRRAAYEQLELLAKGSAPMIPLVTLGQRFAVSSGVREVKTAAGVLFDGTIVSVKR